MSTVATAPGLSFTVGARPSDPSPLRSDVAGFAGRTRRGRVGQPVRVEGWRGYLREFGGLMKEATTTYAIRGYFENGGEVAHVVRLCGAEAETATAEWQAGALDAEGRLTADSPTAFRYAQYRIEATSPGRWARDTRISIRYRLQGTARTPEVDFTIQVPEEPPEYFVGLRPQILAEEIAARSLFIRLQPVGPEAQSRREEDPPGPRHLSWELTLSSSSRHDDAESPTKTDYLDAIGKLGDEREVALVALPDLYQDIVDEDRSADKEGQAEVLTTLIQQAEALRDRLVLVDLPTACEIKDDSVKYADGAIKWTRDLWQEQGDQTPLRAAAVYHPRLWVRDPFGGITTPLRSIPPSGHVAGVISRLDRERGAHHTPANAPVLEAVDVTQAFAEPVRGLLNTAGINLLRCMPGHGLQVWGGRTLLTDDPGRFVAHRRLIHRLVRAIRRVAEPLVFYTNGPELWLTFVRSITTVLLEAYRAGALKGNRPEEAFRVRCDETTTPPEEQELGRVFCEIEVAPAVPMEFILLRIALSSDGTLEVFES